MEGFAQIAIVNFVQNDVNHEIYKNIRKKTFDIIIEFYFVLFFEFV